MANGAKLSGVWYRRAGYLCGIGGSTPPSVLRTVFLRLAPT